MPGCWKRCCCQRSGGDGQADPGPPGDPLRAAALNWFVMNRFSPQLTASNPAIARLSSTHPIDITVWGKYCSVLLPIHLLLFLLLFVKGGSQVNPLCCWYRASSLHPTLETWENASLPFPSARLPTPVTSPAAAHLCYKRQV